MLKYLKNEVIEDGISFADHTLLLPAVSVGNIGQLTVDVILANAGSPVPQKIGRVFHRGIEAAVGADPCPENGDKSRLMTSCEIFRIPERKFIIMHFHAPVTANGKADFVEFLASWIKTQNFKQVVCLSSTYASERNDQQLAGVPFRFLATDDTDSGLTDILKRLEWQSLERRLFPAPAVIDGEDAPSANNNDGVLYLPGSGITMQLHEKCVENGIPFLALIMFASEGDNTPEALTMFEAFSKLFSVCSTKEADGVTFSDITIPQSWGQFFGRDPPAEIY